MLVCLPFKTCYVKLVLLDLSIKVKQLQNPSKSCGAFFDNYGGADVVKLETVPKLICLANQIEELM